MQSQKGYTPFHVGVVDQFGKMLNPDEITSFTVYNTGTRTQATIYQDRNGQTSFTNPATAHNGWIKFWGAGPTYDVVAVTDYGTVELAGATGGDNTLEVQRKQTGIRGQSTKAADVLPVPLTGRVCVMTTGDDAEALTLADGEPGQRLTLVLGTDGGGNGTLTPATKTGFATIVFADAGDMAELEYVDDHVGWILCGAAGVAAPPAITI